MIRHFNGLLLPTEPPGTRTHVDLNEHDGDRFTLYVNQRIGEDAPWHGVYLTAAQTEQLRRLLNRAHKQRQSMRQQRGEATTDAR